MKIEVELTKIGEQDILFGKGGSQQLRWGSLVEIAKVTIIKPLDTFNDLRAVDTDKFIYAMVRGKYNEDDEEAGYFYYFDPESLDDENPPLVIRPNKDVGRWKMIPYALDKIKAYVEAKLKEQNDKVTQQLQEQDDKITKQLADQDENVANTLDNYTKNELPPLAEAEVRKQAEIIVPEIAEELIRNELPALIADALVPIEAKLLSLTTKVGTIPENVEVPTKNYTLQFVEKNNIVRSRLYMANETTAEPALSGNTTFNENGVKGFGEDTLVENPKFSRVSVDTRLAKIVNLQYNQRLVLFKLPYNDKLLLFGVLKIKIKNRNGVYLSFNVAFNGIDNFKIFNVFYAPYGFLEKNFSSYGGLMVAGYAVYVYTSGSNIEFSLGSINTSNVVVEVDYAEMNYIPRMTTDTLLSPSSTNKIYAIREGGGAFIQELGLIKWCGRTDTTAYDGMPLKFYYFLNGYVRWSGAMSLNSTFFHQYANGGFISTNIDVSDRILANTGSLNGSSAGVLRPESLPNITGYYYSNGHTNVPCVGGGDWTSYGGNRYNNDGVLQVGGALTAWDGSQGNSGRTTTAGQAFRIDASRVSSTYQNNAKVQSNRLVLPLVLQAF